MKDPVYGAPMEFTLANHNQPRLVKTLSFRPSATNGDTVLSAKTVDFPLCTLWLISLSCNKVSVQHTYQNDPQSLLNNLTRVT